MPEPATTTAHLNYLAFGDWRLAYRREGAGPTLVLLHNGGTSHHIWQPVISRLSTKFEMLAPDLLGYGDSSKPGESYDMRTHVESIVRLLDATKVERACLVGNCMGSAISLHLAREFPDRVSGLVLVNPLTQNTFSAGRLAPFLKARKLAPGIVSPAYSALSALRLPGWSAPLALAFQLGQRGRKLGLSRDKTLRRHHQSRGQLRSMLAVLADMDAYAELDRRDFAANADFPPILTIWGAQNRVLSADAGKTLDETLGARHTALLPDCGHLAMMEAPDKVAALIEDFHTHYLADDKHLAD